MESIVIAFFISMASFQVGVNVASDEYKAQIVQSQYRVQQMQETSKQALKDVEDAVNANFSKVRGNKVIEKIIVQWKDELNK